ncbi:MAG: hypothetical protein PHI73_00510 [Patescibacteria group bacterium]|nr:hypothetical protein [Patescibacteria group bacterium]
MLRRIPFHLLFLVLAVILLIPVSPAQALPTQSASDNANIAITIPSPMVEEGQYDVVFDNGVASSSYDWTTNSTIPPALAIEEVWHDVIFSNDVASTSNLNESTTYAVASRIDAASCNDAAIYMANEKNLRLEAVLVVILPTSISMTKNAGDETRYGAQMNC